MIRIRFINFLLISKLIFMDAASFVFLLVVSFLTAVMGSLIGMAMLVLLPVMIFLGVPVYTAVATGRFSMIGIGIGNITKFSKGNRIKLKYFLPFAIAGVIGSFIGASFLVFVNEKLLKSLIGWFMIFVSILVLFEDFIKSKNFYHRITFKHHFLSVAAGLFIGGYIGVIGGGGATLVILLLTLIYGLNLHDAIANQKAVTLPISVIATLVFIYQGLIDYKLGIPLFIVNVAGGWLGADLITKFKAIWLKRILVPIIILLALKLIFF